LEQDTRADYLKYGDKLSQKCEDGNHLKYQHYDSRSRERREHQGRTAQKHESDDYQKWGVEKYEVAGAQAITKADEEISTTATTNDGMCWPLEILGLWR